MLSAPSRFDSASPPALVSSEWWANRGGVPPSALMIWVCVAVLVTWSAPRTMSVTPMSMSSTTEAKVYSTCPSPRISTGSDTLAESIEVGPLIPSTHSIRSRSSRKRQCPGPRSARSRSFSASLRSSAARS
jgi:hypothetical protein